MPCLATWLPPLLWQRRHAHGRTGPRHDQRQLKTHEERSIMKKSIFHLVTGTALALALSVSTASAQKKYDTGATDTEIKIGQTNPFSGPASAYATIGKTQAAYMKMINDQGG